MCTLHQGKIPLYDAVERALQKNSAASRLLFVVDQFEELYSLCLEPEVCRQFLDGLLAAVEAGNERRPSHFALLLTLRAGFLGHALTHRPIADALQGGSLMMGPMSRDELRRVQAHPGGAFGVAFRPDSEMAFSVGIDGALLEWQIADPSVDELLIWVHESRHLRELTCKESAQYGVEPLCEVGESVPATTP